MTAKQDRQRRQLVAEVALEFMDAVDDTGGLTLGEFHETLPEGLRQHVTEAWLCLAQAGMIEPDVEPRWSRRRKTLAELGVHLPGVDGSRVGSAALFPDAGTAGVVP